MGKYKITIITHGGVGQFEVDNTPELRSDIARELEKFPMLFFHDIDRDHVGEVMEYLENGCGPHTRSIFRNCWALHAELILDEG